jgi:hypothetical protein
MEANADFGCGACFRQADAALAWQAMRGFTTVAELIDESHFRVTIRACPRCRQRCVWVFTESVDWADGDDPQCWSVLPVRDDEADAFAACGARVDLARIEALGRGRTHLRHDAPKGGASTTAWVAGFWIGPHD